MSPNSYHISSWFLIFLLDDLFSLLDLSSVELSSSLLLVTEV